MYVEKIALTPRGGLVLYRRKGIGVEQGCPFDDHLCGEWCPLFGNIVRLPSDDIRYVEVNGAVYQALYALKLCRNTIYAEEYEGEQEVLVVLRE